MDEAGAAQRILPKSKQKKVIGKAQIETVIAKVARIPKKTVSHDDKQVLQFLCRDLKNMVYGQENAIDALVAAVKMSRSGLALPDKPIGSFLFRPYRRRQNRSRQTACLLDGRTAATL